MSYLSKRTGVSSKFLGPDRQPWIITVRFGSSFTVCLALVISFLMVAENWVLAEPHDELYHSSAIGMILFGSQQKSSFFSPPRPNKLLKGVIKSLRFAVARSLCRRRVMEDSNQVEECDYQNHNRAWTSFRFCRLILKTKQDQAGGDFDLGRRMKGEEIGRSGCSKRYDGWMEKWFGARVV